MSCTPDRQRPSWARRKQPGQPGASDRMQDPQIAMRVQQMHVHGNEARCSGVPQRAARDVLDAPGTVGSLQSAQLQTWRARSAATVGGTLSFGHWREGNKRHAPLEILQICTLLLALPGVPHFWHGRGLAKSCGATKARPRPCCQRAGGKGRARAGMRAEPAPGATPVAPLGTSVVVAYSARHSCPALGHAHATLPMPPYPC